MDSTVETLWQRVYGTEHPGAFAQLTEQLDRTRQLLAQQPANPDPDWYRNAIVYSLYVDAFAGDFDGLTQRLDYLATLGVNTLWLLPILDSPMRDQGFDIRDFKTIREELGGNTAFNAFIQEAHRRGIRILFDMAVNHSSDQHPWFQSASASRDSPYRDYYIWNPDRDRYQGARLIFKGMVNSNWSYNDATDDYYFHRFYSFQPDLNYRNPHVLVAMMENFLYWKIQGVDGLRMDAIPFIWKEEGTSCEDLPTTHTLLKLIRAALDYCEPGTLLIAEANMAPKDVVGYFGNDDECQAAYHFPLMPQFYMALAESNRRYIEDALSPSVTPAIPEKSCWMSFLRCHDELTLEFVSPDVREKMNRYYLHDPECTFREGEGLAGRLFYLVKENPDKALLLNALLFATEGSPILYYGDEVGMTNDVAFYRENSARTGFKDARFMNRGDMNWSKVDAALNQPGSIEHRLFQGIQQLIEWRRRYSACFYHSAHFLADPNPAVYSLERTSGAVRLVILHNLSASAVEVAIDRPMTDLGSKAPVTESVRLPAFGYAWLEGQA
ncbi:alpha-amylase family glycosyl hydrolase [Saccharospirillum impatiens]|uniref:alpha-amylase family glycosyl hydrolase n=1 Tax=Saccharospirillum impatiens TaxID=169438 RepID=UPI000424B034|nr:alpha-amylase family glycosyl hydrolase [Saccharospirillum impatiens]